LKKPRANLGYVLKHLKWKPVIKPISDTLGSGQAAFGDG
jgi:hypothetical protein